MLKSCLTPGCPRLTEESRCPECRRAERRRKRKDPNLTGNQARADNTTRYQRVRRAALRRDGYACQDCGSQLDLNVHHIDGDARHHTLENTVTLCGRCHVARHRQTGP